MERSLGFEFTGRVCPSNPPVRQLGYKATTCCESRPEGNAQSKWLAYASCKAETASHGYQDVSPDGKRRKTGDKWLAASLSPWRQEAFGGSFNSPENQVVRDQFNDVVFGITALFGNSLVGGHEQQSSEYNTKTREDFGYNCSSNPINFRTLFLSCFKPHGGLEVSKDSTLDQHVVYVRISTDAAADILTIRRFLNLSVEQLTPGRPGCSRYIVLAGDQPSYKMFSELCLESWRNTKNNNSRARTSPTFDDGDGELPLH